MTQSISGSAEAAPPTEQSPPKRRKPALPLLLAGLVLVGGVAGGIWYILSRPHAEGLTLSGRIEGYPTDVGAKVGGRVAAVAVREGDRVRSGQVIVKLDDSEIQAQLREAEARIVAAQQQEQQALFQIQVVQNQIQEAQLTVQQSAGDAQGRIYQAEANVAAAQAQLAQSSAQLNQAKAELQLAAVDRDRFAQLWQEGASTRQQYDRAITNYNTAVAVVNSREAAVAAAQRQVNAFQGGAAQARSTGLNPQIRSTQVAALNRQLGIATAQLRAAQAQVKAAIAAKQQIVAQVAYLSITSPLEGVVITRSVEPGQVVATGKTLLTLLDPKQVYLRGFIPEGQVGQVRVGQAARVYLDSAPDRPLEAQVSAVDTQASFTPENIYFKEDRVRQVFGVRLSLSDPQGFAKPGMPADGEILTGQAAR